MIPSEDSGNAPTPAEAAFLEFVRCQERGEQPDFEALCAEQSGLAGDLRSLHAAWSLVSGVFARGAGGFALAEQGGGNGGADAGGESDSVASVLAKLDSNSPPDTRYQIREPIARGGMGVILKAWDENLRRELAMKVMLDGAERPAGDTRAMGRFLEEAQLTGQLEHPGIVPVHELGVDRNGRAYYTMKLVRGRDLREVFRWARQEEEGWSLTRALSVILRVCEAMAFAHDKGVIHRDLKPSNIMVGRFGETYVMDWGLARVLDREPSPGESSGGSRRMSGDGAPDASLVWTDRDDSGSPLLTRRGDVVGTPAYMPPEQADGELDALGPTSDVYSVGAILYQLLTGRAPYLDPDQKPSSLEVLEQVRAGPPESIHSLSPEVPAELEAICTRAMAREAGGRYADMEQLATDLRAYLEGRVVVAYESGALAELKKWVLRNRAVAITAVAALVMVSVISVISFLRVTDERDIAQEERERVLRLTAPKTLSYLKATMDTHWPATPDRADEMDVWLDDARELLADLPRHRRDLRDLRERGTALESAIEGERSFEFDDPEDLWWHRVLVALVSDLEAFGADDIHAATLRNMEQRVEFARTIRRRSIEEPRDAWSQAIAMIADRARSPEYDGLRLDPQLGLIPLGRDPVSGLFEFWHLQTGDRPERDDRGRQVVGAETGLVMVLIPGGSFWMGAQKTEKDGPNYDPLAVDGEWNSANGSAVERTLDPFLLSKYEMTQAQWKRITGEIPSWFAASWVQYTGPAFPVDQVSWEQSDRIMSRLGLVLPTEAQWEYSCRAGTTTPWASGLEPESLVEYANTRGRSYGKDFTHEREGDWEEYDDGFGVPARVGSLKPNRFGLHDSLGNVWEWCQDGFWSYDVGSIRGNGAHIWEQRGLEVARGGAFRSWAASARSAVRKRSTPWKRFAEIGLRPARAVVR